MLFAIEVEDDTPHRWIVATCKCNPDDPADTFVGTVVDAIRNSYGEDELVSMLTVDEGVEQRFDLDAVKKAVRMGLPDPIKEKNKPAQLTNYRSETSEVIARCALTEGHGIAFPSNPQAGKTNANQPVLGFDGWGLLRLDGTAVFVLVQVKGTEDPGCPPAEANVLAAECARVPVAIDELCRALTILALRLNGQDKADIVGMLQLLGRGELPQLAVAPVVVRGTKEGCFEDMRPIRLAVSTFLPAFALGAVVSIGATLVKVGKEAMTRARAA